MAGNSGNTTNDASSTGIASAEDALQTYETISDGWIARSEQIDILQLYQPVLDLLPSTPASILDIGAGTGRDAAWFTEQGYQVTAIEPAEKLRHVGKRLHADKPIDWADAYLPDLAGLEAGKHYDLQVMIGVWQHLPEVDRPAAMTRLSDLADTKGRVILSLRHGPGAPGRPVFPIDVDATTDLAKGEGFKVLRQVPLPSIQPWNQENGVVWTWLVLEAE